MISASVSDTVSVVSSKAFRKQKRIYSYGFHPNDHRCDSVADDGFGLFVTLHTLPHAHLPMPRVLK